jgi:hypothetical protein
LDYGFAEVERAFASIHNIADDKRPAFVGRLQHLQKLKFPAGTNTGRGRAARYQPHHIFLIAIVLQLNELGMNPDKAIRLTKRSNGFLAAGVVAALSPSPLHLDSPLICHVPTSNLEDLATHHVSDFGLRVSPLSKTWASTDEHNPPFWRPGLLARSCWFSFSGLIYSLAFYIQGIEGEPPEDDELAALEAVVSFWAELRKWAEPIAAEHKLFLADDAAVARFMDGNDT